MWRGKLEDLECLIRDFRSLVWTYPSITHYRKELTTLEIERDNLIHGEKSIFN